MKKVHDFTKGRRGAVVRERGKTRITIFLDDAVLRHFRALAEKTGRGYQTLINDALAERATNGGTPLTAAAVRKIVREEIAAGRDD